MAAFLLHELKPEHAEAVKELWSEALLGADGRKVADAIAAGEDMSIFKRGERAFIADKLKVGGDMHDPYAMYVLQNPIKNFWVVTTRVINADASKDTLSDEERVVGCVG